MISYHTVRVAVFAFFVKDHKVLLLLRKNTGWMDGKFGVPSGHLEKGETIKEALVREIQEEVGVTVDETDLTFYHIMHYGAKHKADGEYINLFFKVEYWQGEPINKEPHKSERVEWFDLDSLPENMVPSVKVAIEHFRNKLLFTEFS